MIDLYIWKKVFLSALIYVDLVENGRINLWLEQSDPDVKQTLGQNQKWMERKSLEKNRA